MYFSPQMDEMHSVSAAMEEASLAISPLTAEQEQELDEELAALLAAATTAEKNSANIPSSSDAMHINCPAAVAVPSEDKKLPPQTSNLLVGEGKAADDKKSLLVVS